ncbi:MAG TPA: hypothetical protein VHE35_19905 [Kofleriaceae bacterium]|nr:hypothetical protein [Kofleriaceae bacterium]
MTQGKVDVDTAGLDARSESAWRRLATAIRLDLNRFITAEVEQRLRARPNFFARMPQTPLIGLRGRVDEEAAKAAAALDQPVTDLRVYYGAESRSADEEDRGFVKTVGERAVEVTERLLMELAFPGDDKPDPVASPGVDLDATYKLAFEPSTSLVWAWRQVRELDTVRNQLADGAPPSFETRWHFPELPRAAT